MKLGISLKIDVTKIEKHRLYTGKKGMYLDATLFVDVDTQDQYGNNGMIKQTVSQDERAQGVAGNILGNVKVFWRDGASVNQPGLTPTQQEGTALAKDDIPF